MSRRALFDRKTFSSWYSPNGTALRVSVSMCARLTDLKVQFALFGLTVGDDDHAH